jgi:hypothetical protein
MAGIETLIHGRKPDIVDFKATDPIEMLKKLLNGEISDWPQIQQLSQLFQQNQFDQMGFDLKGLLAAGGENAAQTEKNALAWQKGEIPPEAQEALRRFGAQQNMTSGMGFWNPEAGGANQIRNFFAGPGGLMDYQKAGIDAAAAGGNATQRWQQIAQGTMLPASSYLYSPQWFTQYMAEQEQAREANKQLKFNTAAAPDPAAAGIAGTVTGIIGAIYGHGGGGNNYSDYQGQYANATKGNIPVSQFSGLGGTISDFFGGNLGQTGNTPPYMGMGGGPNSDVTNPGYPVTPAAPVNNSLPPGYNENSAYNNPFSNSIFSPEVFNQSSNIG